MHVTPKAFREAEAEKKVERWVSGGGFIGRGPVGVHLLLSQRKNYSEIITAANQSFWRGI